ncbi:MAG: hypothetical protein MZU95_04735 [Desulfomicrobium escambiense]|nr:hypothetical protein [Desulfomicrobium escambiense]
MIHGVTPGPFLLTENPDVFWGVIASHVPRQRHAARPEPAAGRPVGAVAARALRFPGAVAVIVCLDRGPRRSRTTRSRSSSMAGFGLVGYAAAQARLRAGPAAAGLHPGADGGEGAAAEPAAVGRGVRHLRAAADLRGSDRPHHRTPCRASSPCG